MKNKTIARRALAAFVIVGMIAIGGGADAAHAKRFPNMVLPSSGGSSK